MFASIALRLLGVRKLLASAWGWVTGSAVHLLLAALIASNAAWFIGHRIEAHSLGKVRGQLAKCTQGRADDRKAVAAAQAKATAAQLAANRAAEAAYSTKAREADVAHTQALDDAQRATDRFIAAHRVRPEISAGRVSPTAPAEGHDPGVPAVVSADSELVIGDVDVRACTTDATNAVSAYKWAQSLIDAGLAQ